MSSDQKPTEPLATPINVFVFGVHLKTEQLENLFGPSVWSGLINIHHPLWLQWKKGQMDPLSFGLWAVRTKFGPDDQFWFSVDFWNSLFMKIQESRGDISSNLGSVKRQKTIRAFLGNLLAACEDGQEMGRLILAGSKILFMDSNDPFVDRESKIKASIAAVSNGLDDKGKKNVVLLARWLTKALGPEISEHELRARIREAYEKSVEVQ